MEGPRVAQVDKEDSSIQTENFSKKKSYSKSIYLQTFVGKCR